MQWNPTLRRHFLQGAGKAALVLPFLPSLVSRKAEAQATATKQKSFVAIPIWNHIGKQFNADETEARMVPATLMPSYINMKPVSGAKHPIFAKSLVDAKNDNPAGRISELVDASFNSMLPKMNFYQGLDY